MKETKEQVMVIRDILRRENRLMKRVLAECKDEIITLRIQNRLYLEALKQDASE